MYNISQSIRREWNWKEKPFLYAICFVVSFFGGMMMKSFISIHTHKKYINIIPVFFIIVSVKNFFDQYMCVCVCVYDENVFKLRWFYFSRFPLIFLLYFSSSSVVYSSHTPNPLYSLYTFVRSTTFYFLFYSPSCFF